MKDISGSRFGMLVALAPVYKVGRNWKWRFQCSCGGECVRNAGDLAKQLRAGSTPNCGCSRQTGFNRTHGLSRHGIYHAWRSMQARCLDPSHPNFKYYGGRGIKIDPTWLESFEAFWAAMEPTYKNGLQLDRIDTDGHYQPGNCRWVTPKENSRNKRNNRLIDTPWGCISISEAAEKTGIRVGTLFYRINTGWDAEAALTTPVAPCGPKPKHPCPVRRFA